MQYERTQLDLYPGAFRARGDVLEILPAYDEVGVRVEYFGDEIERITRFDPLRGEAIEEVERISVYPRLAKAPSAARASPQRGDIQQPTIWRHDAPPC